MKSAPGEQVVPKMRSHVALLAGVVAVVGVAGLANPSVYATSIVIGMYALMALPLGFLFGQGGTISIAQATFAAIGGFTTAILTTKAGWSPLATLVPAMVLPAVVAWLISRPILRLPELPLALATLAIGTVAEVILLRADHLTGGFDGLSGVPQLPLIGGSRLGAHVAIWLLVIAGVAIYDMYCASSRGRALNAIRVDRLLAESMGVRVAPDLSLLFATTAAVAGLAGWFYAHYQGYIAPASLNPQLSANLLFMVVVGGRKSALGPIVGAAFFTLASDVLPGTESQGIYFGVAIVLTLLLCPNGLLSLRWRRRPPQKLPAQAAGQEVTA